MNVIEKHIHEHFARMAASGGADEPMTNGGAQTTHTSTSEPEVLTPPFAKVNSVVTGSPADTAGLKAGDDIRDFGYVNNTNHDGLKRVAECVQGNEGVSYHFRNCTGRILTYCSGLFLSKSLGRSAEAHESKSFA